MLKYKVIHLSQTKMPNYKESTHKKSVRNLFNACQGGSIRSEYDPSEEIYRPRLCPQPLSMSKTDNSSLIYQNFDPVYESIDRTEKNFVRNYSGRNTLRARPSSKNSSSVLNKRSYLDLPIVETSLGQYICQLCKSITLDLGIDINEWEPKKRKIYASKIEEQLQKKMSKEAARAKKKFNLAELLTSTQLATIGTSGGLGIGLASLAAAAGAGATAGMTAFITIFGIAFYIAYKAFSSYIKNKDAQKLSQFSIFLEDEDILQLISLLATLYTVDLLDAELYEKFELKNLINPKKILEYLNNYQDKETAGEWSKEVRVIHNQVKQDCKLMIKNLKKIVNKHHSVPFISEFTNILIPSQFYNSNFSPRFLQRRKALEGWLTALEMTILSKKNNSAYRNFDQKLRLITSNSSNLRNILSNHYNQELNDAETKSVNTDDVSFNSYYDF